MLETRLRALAPSGGSRIAIPVSIANGGTNNSLAYTSGAVIYFDGTKLTQNATNFLWDNVDIRLHIGGNNPLASLDISNKAISTGASSLKVTPGAHTLVTAEVLDCDFAAHTMTISGSYATQRFSLFAIPSVTAISTQTITDAATLAIVGAPAVLGSAVITNAWALWIQAGNTRMGRLYRNVGTAIAATDWALSGWGANATVSAVSGNDSRGTVTVTTSVLDTPSANPTVTLTFKNGTWTTAPFATANLGTTGTGLTGAVEVNTTATTLVLEFVGTPTALSSNTYVFWYMVIG